MQPVLEQRQLPEEAWTSGPEGYQRGARTDALLDSPVDVDDAVRLALLNHPRISAALQQLRATGARAFQQVLLQNPEVEIEVLFDDLPEIDAEATFDLATVLHWSLRRDIADNRVETARVETAESVVDLIYSVRTAYYDHVADLQRLDVSRRVLDAAEASAQAAELLRQAGNITELELLTHQGFAAEVRQSVIRREADAAASRHDLHRAMGLPDDRDRWETPTRLPRLPETTVDADELVDRAVEQSLAIDRLQRRQATGESLAKFHRRRGWMPEFSIGVSTDYHFDDDRLLVGPVVGVALPLFDRRQYAVDAHRADAMEAMYRRRQIRQQLTGRARTTARRLQAAHEEARHIEQRVLPLAERTVEEAMRQFNAMELGVFELLEAHRSRMRAGESHTEALRNFWLQRTRADRLIAGGFEGEAPPTSEESDP